MEATQDQLLRLARKLGATESAATKAKLEHEELVRQADKVRDLIFANLAATGSPQERQDQLVRLLAQATTRGELRGQGRQTPRKKKKVAET